MLAIHNNTTKPGGKDGTIPTSQIRNLSSGGDVSCHHLAEGKWGARIQTLIFLTPKPWGHPHATSTLHGSLFSRAGTCSNRQYKQREKEGAQQSVGAWRVAVPVPLSCLIPRFCITLAFHMFTSHFSLLMLTLTYPRRECWLEACFLMHHGGAKNVLWL